MNASWVTHEDVTFAGPAGPLVGTLAYGQGATRGVVLLAGPHPYMGGTVENNVVAGLADGLAGLGYATLRFDYRTISAQTVEESMLAFWQTGRTPQDGQLIDEARCARRWLGEQLSPVVHLVGYSFGCEVVSQIADDATASLTLVAPTVKHHDLAGARVSVAPKLVVYSDNDFATSQLATETWYASVRPPKALHCVFGADHFFKGGESELVDRTASHLAGAASGSVTESVDG